MDVIIKPTNKQSKITITQKENIEQKIKNLVQNQEFCETCAPPFYENKQETYYELDIVGTSYKIQLK